MKKLGNASMGRGVILSMVLAVLMFAAIFSALVEGQGIPAQASSNSGCLLGTYTTERSGVVSDPVTGAKHEVLVSVKLNVVKVKEGEFLVSVSTTLTPRDGGKVTIMFTPPLTDVIVSTDTGNFRWSQGKYFIQAIVSKELPITSKIGMKVRGECVKAVIVKIRPLKTTIAFGTGYPAEIPPRNTRVVGGETAGYVIVIGENGSLRIYRLQRPMEGMLLEGSVARNVTIPCNVVVGGVVLHSVTVKVYVPKNLSKEQLETALQPLIAACAGNLSKLRGVAVVFSNKSIKEVLRSIYASAELLRISSPAAAVMATRPTTASPTTVTVTETTVVTRTENTSTYSYPTVPTTAPAQAVPKASATITSHVASTPLPLATSSKALATAVALGVALVASVIAYLIVVKRT